MRAEEKRVRIELDMYQTMAVAVLALMLGRYLRKKCWLTLKIHLPRAERLHMASGRDGR